MMIVKVVMPANGTKGPVDVYNNKGFKTTLPELPAEVIQALKGDRKGYFEAELTEKGVCLKNRTSAQQW